MPRKPSTMNDQEYQEKRGPGRPPRERPMARSALSMKAEDADLVLSCLSHATRTGRIPAPAAHLAGKPFAGVISLLRMLCERYASENGVEVIEHDAKG